MSNCFPSFIVRWILNFVDLPTHENHGNWYPTNKSDFTIISFKWEDGLNSKSNNNLFPQSPNKCPHILSCWIFISICQPINILQYVISGHWEVTFQVTNQWQAYKNIEVSYNEVVYDKDREALHVNDWLIGVLHLLSNISAMSWWEQVNFQWNDDEVRFELDQHA